MENNTSKSKTKKRATVRPMIITPIVFVLIAMIIAAPVSIKGFQLLTYEVHDIQHTLSKREEDYQPDDTYFNECLKEGTPQTVDGLKYADKVAEIECNNAAISCDVYYGYNSVSLPNSACLSTDDNSKLFGEGGRLHIDGNTSSEFKALENVEKGDVFTVKTTGGEYQYTVKDIQILDMKKDTYPKVKGEHLLITTQASHDVFAHQNMRELVVVATLGAEAVQ